MSDEDGADRQPPRSDPLADVVTLLAAPIASGIRSFEQLWRGVDELFRAVDNVNTTMENLNEAASRLNRLLADVEDPIRAMVPQLTRTVHVADEVLQHVQGPVTKVAPNLGKIAETLTSPAFVSLPNQLEEFVSLLGDMTRRLGPLTQFAESAGGLFGIGVRRPGASHEAGSSGSGS
jgi:ABC-type transporter Mla subunit MlaD